MHPEIQSVFLGSWVGHKNLSLAVGDDRALRAALRVLLATYDGPPVRLFRGTTARERRRRRYGTSWTSNREIAELFAERHDGGLLIETLALPEAILCDVAAAGGPYDESEYLVDRRHLRRVN